MNADLWLATVFAETHPAEAARVLESLPMDEGCRLLEHVPDAVSADILSRAAPASAAMCLAMLTPPHAGCVLASMEPDRAAGLLRRISEKLRAILVGATPKEAAQRIIKLLKYPEDSAGALMDPSILAFPVDMTSREAWERFCQTPQQAIYYLYVVDRSQRLVGVLTIRDLAIKAAEEPLSAVMKRNVVALRELATRERIVSHPGWREFHALPVIDAQGAFQGAIRYETVRRLEEGVRQGVAAVPIGKVGLAVGELYWLGLVGMLEGMVSTFLQGKRGKQEGK